MAGADLKVRVYVVRVYPPLMTTVFLAQLLQQVLRPDEMIVEDLSGHFQQLSDEGIAQRVAHSVSFLARADDIFRAQHGQLLGDERLRQGERVLQLLDAALAAPQRLEDADAHRMREGAEEFGLEGLQIMGGRRHTITIY